MIINCTSSYLSDVESRYPDERDADEIVSEEEEYMSSLSSLDSNPPPAPQQPEPVEEVQETEEDTASGHVAAEQAVAFVTFKGEVYYTQPYGYPTNRNESCSEPSTSSSLSSISLDSGYGNSPPPVAGLSWYWRTEPSQYTSRSDDAYTPASLGGTPYDPETVASHLRYVNIVERNPNPPQLPPYEHPGPYIRPIGPLTDEEILERTEKLAESMVWWLIYDDDQEKNKVKEGECEKKD